MIQKEIEEKNAKGKISRFECPTLSLRLPGGLKSARKAFWSSLAIAFIIHLGLSQIRITGEENNAIKPLTTKFVKREPRLVKPLELRKLPEPKRRPMKRQVVLKNLKKSDSNISQTTSHPIKVLENLARPMSNIERSIGFSPELIEPPMILIPIEGAKEPKDKIDMSLDMLDIDALDTGRYRAMVIFKNPVDRRSIYGYFHLIIIYSESIEKGLETLVSFTVGGRSIVEQEIRALVRAVNRYTDIKMDVIGRYSMDSKEFLRTPFVMVESTTHFDVTDREVENIGKYLTHGGFIFSEVEKHGTNYMFPTGSAADLSFRDMYKRALATQGFTFERDWIFEQLPNDHPVYHCYFDFDGPPEGQINYFTQNGEGLIDYLEGITLDGRLVVIHSNKDMSDLWYLNVENTRVLQFAVNMVIFALTQEGSITNQAMHHVQ